MDLPRSTYHATPKLRPSDEAIVAEMRAITDAFECYGYRRVTAELRPSRLCGQCQEGPPMMREHDLAPQRRRRFTRTTNSDHDGPIFPFVARDYEVHGPDQLWVADLTYVAIANWLRLRCRCSGRLVAPHCGICHRPQPRCPARRCRT
jgi:putative transposase